MALSLLKKPGTDMTLTPYLKLMLEKNAQSLSLKPG
ncbi:MAG: hypothetical protein RIQ94_1281, partial [Pseudomonadota bacterium]